MPNSIRSASVQPNSPDYVDLVQFLVVPLLESPKSLSIDCERSKQNQKVWLRLAFEATDRGRVFGRGGRNIQAIRTVLEAAAAIAHQSIHLDIYGGYETHEQRDQVSAGKQSSKRHSHHRPISKSGAKHRPHSH